MKFRQDINALRAIAVLVVVLFHFSPSLLKGGFIGVDVFFVISGFLMTSIIMERIKNEQFRLKLFYISRVSRIVPALAFMCGVMLLVGFFILLPLDYEMLGKHIRDSITFISNYTYERESGYFDQEAKRKWLLHTWSLSVEWQFYLIFPLILMAISKLNLIAKVREIVALLTLVSFLWCIYLGSVDPNSVYFQLTSRAWELLLGSFGYFYQGQLNQRAGYFGWVLIIVSSFIIDESYIWPSALTLIPVSGALIVILSNNPGPLSKTSVTKRLGLYSYSIYLWHWPIVVGLSYFNMSNYWFIIGFLVSVFLGAMSYHFIEPIGKAKNKKNIYYIFSVLIFIYLCSAYVRRDGLPERWTLSEEVKYIYANINQTPRKECGKKEPENACELFSDDPSWAVFGDSHSYELAYSLGEVLQKYDDGVIEYSRSGCPLITNKDNILYEEECANWRLRVIDLIINDASLKNVVMINRYNAGLFGKNETIYPNIPDEYSEQHREDFFSSIEKAVSDITQSGKNVWLISGVPEMGRDIYSLISQAHIKGSGLDNLFANDINYQLRRNEYSFNKLKAISLKYPNVHFVNIRDIFCDKSSCYAIRDGVPLYRDDDHLSLLGASKVSKLLLEQYEQKEAREK